MDYSSLPNDPDHAVGSSPWQSSPQPSGRPFTASAASSTPSSPLARHSSHTGDAPQADQDGGEEHGPATDEAEYTPSLAGQTNAESEINGNSYTASNNEQLPSVMQQPPHSQQQQPGRQPQQQQQRTAPHRYHGTAQRNQQKQNLPQYKLRAKITSLERTGRKDPVLRFDVHVRSSSRSGSSFCGRKEADDGTDKFAQIPHHAIPRRQTHAFRIHEIGRPPNLI